jgi:hypothetical protein
MRPGVDPYRDYRGQHRVRKEPSPTGAPWLLLSEHEIAEWMLRHPEATSPSETIVRCLTWLEQEFAVGAHA